MIPKIINILYATDLSANSAYAFCYAVNLAEKHNARIEIAIQYNKSPIDVYEIIKELS
jgi:hypothetical protein